jgi:hypothetical protein
VQSESDLGSLRFASGEDLVEEVDPPVHEKERSRVPTLTRSF